MSLRRGFTAGADQVAQEKAEREARKNAPRRFWLPQGKSQHITFVDGQPEDPPVFQEHEFKKAGTKDRIYAVCVQGEKGPDGKPRKCRACAKGNKPYFAAAFTIIDHSSYTSKRDNKVYKDQIRLLVVKSQVFSLLEAQMKKRGGLAGARYEVTRSDKDKSPATGDVFDFEEKIDVAKVYPDAKPLDYDKLFASPTDEYLDALADGHVPYESDDHGGGGDEGDEGGRAGGTQGLDDDIPF